MFRGWAEGFVRTGNGILTGWQQAGDVINYPCPVPLWHLLFAGQNRNVFTGMSRQLGVFDTGTNAAQEPEIWFAEVLKPMRGPGVYEPCELGRNPYTPSFGKEPGQRPGPGR